MEIALRRNVEDILHGYEGLIRADVVERQKAEKRIVFTGIGPILEKYAECIRQHSYFDAYTIFLRGVAPVLTPVQINNFLQETIAYENRESQPWHKGKFVGWLIEESYKAGHNHFVLNTKAGGRPLRELCCWVKCRKRQPLEIKVDGPLGMLCGGNSEHIILSADSIGEQCGAEGKNLTINASSIGNYCGEQGNHVIVSAEEGGYYCGRNATESIFRTSNMETLERMKYYVARFSKNRIYFIHPDGSEEKIAEEEWRD